MASRLTTSLREAPATVPALAALALFVIWATDQAGYPLTHWAPGGLILLVLLALALALVPIRARDIALRVKIALACLAGYTALSFLSILWAGVQADAWEGANRTLLYLLVFALFACWRKRGSSAALLLSMWALALTALAAFVALHVTVAADSALGRLLPNGRLVYPTGYANANAALWLGAFWPAFLLARSARLPWALRGALAGGAVLLADVALLGQSRGAFYATPIMLVLVFALVPGRLRTFALLVPVAGAIAATAPAVLRVGNSLAHDQVVASHLHAAVVAILIAALAVGVVVALASAAEQRAPVSARSRARLRTAIAACAAATLIGALAGGLAAAGDPVARLRHGWNTFKSVKGYGANSSGGRLTSGLGSNRYDFFRVALDEFSAHPLVGIGADNFQLQYLRHGRSNETPRYPHSVELRTLAETGVAGFALALVGLGAALAACFRNVRAPRSTDPLASDVAVAALGGFAYWLVHGSFDWFWEFAGLGAPAFALLGLVCSLSPAAAPTAPFGGEERDAPDAPAAPPRATRGARARRAALAARMTGALVALCAALAAAASLTAPWLSQLEIQSAARIWPRAPLRAYARLRDAASLNPLSDQADLAAGSIALRYGDLSLADRKFASALARSPEDPYAMLERGAISSSSGNRVAALSLLERALSLQPRDLLTRRALGLARAGRRVDVEELNRAILKAAGRLR
jgi:tetratricopeptide (TPR) repeat protein